jgi:hypothetical protein
MVVLETIIEACIGNERRATNGSPEPRTFTSELPNISYARINEACIGNERRATNGSPEPRTFTSELPNISYARISLRLRLIRVMPVSST